MKTKPVPKAEQDYRIFFVFMSFIFIGMYFASVVDNPAMQNTWRIVLFTLLLIVHIALHWIVNRFMPSPKNIWTYIVIQSVLAFIIVSLSANIGMVFALYMALIGETIGILRASRWSALAIFFYLILSVINFILITDLDSAITWLSAAIPVAIFVTLYVTLYNRQADAREQAQKLADELESANRELSEYAALVEDLTIVNERQRMARELHDTLSQGLAGLILQLEAADAHLTNKRNENAQSIISNAMVQARTTLADARNAIDNLRKSTFDNLDSALRNEIDRFSNATSIPVHFHPVQTPPLPDPVQENLIRALGEALSNIAQHAKAQNVNLDVEVTDQTLLVTIQDDGVGFDPGSIPSGHYGLLGIKERVRLINGTFEVNSQLNKGATLKLQIPL